MFNVRTTQKMSEKLTIKNEKFLNQQMVWATFMRFVAGT